MKVNEDKNIYVLAWLSTGAVGKSQAFLNRDNANKNAERNNNNLGWVRRRLLGQKWIVISIPIYEKN